MSEFAHQVGFRQTLGCNRDGGLTACWLPKEASLVGIEAQFEQMVAKGWCRDSSHSHHYRAARWLARAGTSDSVPGTERRDQGRASPLPMLDDRSDPSAQPPDRPVRERGPVRPNWEDAD
jgi:hypothetical protein